MKTHMTIAMIVAILGGLCGAASGAPDASTNVVAFNNPVCPVVAGDVDGTNCVTHDGIQYGMCCAACAEEVVRATQFRPFGNGCGAPVAALGSPAAQAVIPPPRRGRDYQEQSRVQNLSISAESAEVRIGPRIKREGDGMRHSQMRISASCRSRRGTARNN